MTISYPLETPTVIGPSAVELYAIHATSVSRSPFTFSSQVQSYTGQRWGATVTLPRMKREHAEEWIAFLLSLKGQYGTFRLKDPSNTAVMGSATGSAQVSGTNSAGSSTLNIKGATASATGWLKAGDYIMLDGGHPNRRLHKVLSQVNTSGTGTATLDIWPDLRYTYTDGNGVNYGSSARGTFRLSSNQTSWSINEATQFGITFDCEEAI